MAIFDGHNDLLLNLWLHHREDPVTAFFAGVENGHLDYPRILQGGLAGGLFALFVPPQEYIARMAPQYASQAWDPLTILGSSWLFSRRFAPMTPAAPGCA